MINYSLSSPVSNHVFKILCSLHTVLLLELDIGSFYDVRKFPVSSCSFIKYFVQLTFPRGEHIQVYCTLLTDNISFIIQMFFNLSTATCKFNEVLSFNTTLLVFISLIFAVLNQQNNLF